MVVGLITDNDERAYREEVRDLAVWCKDNNLSLNVIKTKKMIVDDRKRRTEHAPFSSQGTTEDSAEHTVHHWGQASCHPGPLYQAVSEEGPKNCQRLQPL